MRESSGFFKDMQIPRFLWIILILFFIKCTILAFFITPLWDIPDEPGHYSYIQDIAMGEGLPVLGETIIAPNVVENWWLQNKEARHLNWIAQHPPLYHIFGAIFLKIGGIFTQDPHWLFRIPRLTSVFFATGTLFVIFLFLREFTKDEFFALTCSAIVGLIPMYSNMASGTNHDVGLVFFCSLSILFFYRFISTKLEKNAYLSALFIGAAGAIKFSAGLLAIPILLIIFIYLQGAWLIKLKNMAGICITAAILPGFYLVRNWILFSNPFIISVDMDKTVNIKSVGLIEYLQINPVIDHLFKNFFALIGWTGTGNGDVLLFQISGNFLLLLVISLFIILSLSFWEYIQEIINLKEREKYLIIGFIILTFIIIYMHLFFNKEYILPQGLLYSIILTIPFFSLALIKSMSGDNLFRYFSLTIIAFYFIAFIYFFMIPLYETFGVLRAMHGRYFFPLIPLLIICYIYPAYKLIKPQQWVLFLIIIGAALFELSFYLFGVIPFFQGVFL
ncbi:4-amino-4-deoxy-L-arabinose transferase-like glycosyltransferase [Methanocalculus sp. AMF5]|uniref:ArnT family glycosyltransferase n=1 Tax=Methanocalculus sp. AMF5 TaxID=1198257 RepID=UPI0020A05343|nr:glycosyltransferase family 39 protein [Methanocalculus sp. AMF5]MCP1663314.1 4-amino-4-deoxy-L-arabinose transferase-like glycosyltransferase [Methanocalculus sp. AMF5]